MLDISQLKFDDRGLIPAIVVDAETNAVLTLAYMSRESLAISLEKGLTCFWSRSRQQLWLKGETSGNYQHILSITADCDRDALVVTVRKDGPACHLGTDSCFQDEVYHNNAEPQPFSVPLPPEKAVATLPSHAVASSASTVMGIRLRHSASTRNKLPIRFFI